MAANFVRIQALISLGTVIINITVGSILAHFYGAFGASLSIIMVHIIRLTGYNILIYKQKLNINLGHFFSRTYLRWIPSALISVAASSALTVFTNPQNLILVVIEAAFIFIIYMVCLWLITFNSSEKNLLMGVFQRY